MPSSSSRRREREEGSADGRVSKRARKDANEDVPPPPPPPESSVAPPPPPPQTQRASLDLRALPPGARLAVTDPAYLEPLGSETRTIIQLFHAENGPADAPPVRIDVEGPNEGAVEAALQRLRARMTVAGAVPVTEAATGGKSTRRAYEERVLVSPYVPRDRWSVTNPLARLGADRVTFLRYVSDMSGADVTMAGRGLEPHAPVPLHVYICARSPVALDMARSLVDDMLRQVLAR